MISEEQEQESSKEKGMNVQTLILLAGLSAITTEMTF